MGTRLNRLEDYPQFKSAQNNNNNNKKIFFFFFLFFFFSTEKVTVKARFLYMYEQTVKKGLLRNKAEIRIMQKLYTYWFW